MLIIAGVVLAVVLVPVFHGRLGGLGDLRLVSTWLIAAALGVQVLCISIVPTWPRPLLAAAHGATYVLAALFVWRNRRLPGLPLVAAGGLANAVTIALNGGTLPASAAALRRAGLPVTENQFINSGVLAHPKLAFLGDVFASPAWLPLRNVYSLGDLLILAGAAWAVHRSCRTVLVRDPRPALARWRAATPANAPAAPRAPVVRPLATKTGPIEGRRVTLTVSPGGPGRTSRVFTFTATAPSGLVRPTGGQPLVSVATSWPR